MTRNKELSPISAGVDLGATKILSLVATANGSVLAEDTRPTLGAEGPDAVISRMVDSLQESLRKADLSQDQVRAIGVSAPGPVDYVNGVVTDPPNLPGWNNVPLASILQHEFGIPCHLENDANAAALAEHRWGAGRGSQHMLFLTISSGIGGGIIANGSLYRGASGAGGEMGHMILNEDGPPCGCGRRGCLEAHSSGLAIARQGQELAAKEPNSRLARMAAEDPPLTAESIHRAADEGDEIARELIAGAGHHLGVGIASLINIFDPQVIVLGGSLVKMGDLYLGPMRKAAEGQCFPQSWADVRIVAGELGDEAPALGAAAIAIETL